MHVIRSFFIALSLYSKIPVPQFVWNEEDMQYSLCFFPWVGAVIGFAWLAGMSSVSVSRLEPSVTRLWDVQFRW